MKASHVLVVSLLACGYLGYRVVALSAQVDRLSKQLGAAAGDEARGDGAAEIVRLPDLASADEDHDRRLDDVEADVQELRADVDALADETRQKADLEDVDRSASPDRILGVVTGEVERIRDRQLEFHRDRWLDARESAADDFAERNGLDPHQHEQIRKLLLAEVDAMVEILKTPAAVEEPEQALSDWVAVLEETDRRAKRILAPNQVGAWDEARSWERRAIMPWLPSPPEPAPPE